MLVILRENVENLGQTGEIVKVTEGYARNYLLPRNLVKIASEKNKVALEAHQRALEKKRKAQLSELEAVAKKFADFNCTIARKVGENDKLFGSVTTTDIAHVLKEAGFPVEKRMIVIEQPIKALGVHNVTVRMAPEVSAPLKVWVVKEA